MSDREKLIAGMEKSFRKLLRSHQKNMAAILGKDPTGSEFMFLQHLCDAGTSKASDLAEEFQVNLSHITSVTDKLVAKNLITRVRPKSDRRIVELQITSEGSVTLVKIQRKRNDYFKQRFRDLENKEIQKMIFFFLKLKRSN